MDYEVKTELNGIYIHFNFVQDGVVLGTGQVHLEQRGHLGISTDPRFATARELATIAGKCLNPIKDNINQRAADNAAWDTPTEEHN